jgi:glycerol-3-phosphate cytidylyltransferase
MRTVITYGTFDLFHYGHLRLLERLRALGDHLIVAVSTDEFNAQKGKRSFMPYEQRAQIVAALRMVDRVIPESSWEQKLADVEKYSVDVFGIGDDWKGKFDFLEPYCEVVYLPRTEGVSSTSLRKLARAFDKETVDRLQEAQSIIAQLVQEFQGAQAPAARTNDPAERELVLRRN